MTPYQRLVNGMLHFRTELNEELNEFLTFAEVMARQQNMLTLDEHGTFYVNAAGTLDEIIPKLKNFTERLERIQQQKANPH